MIDKTTTDAITDVVQKEKHKRPKRSEELQTHMEPVENSRYIRHSMEIMSWERPNMANPREVQDRINQYFTLCDTNEMKPSVEGLAFAFDTDRKTLWRWVNGIDSKYIPDENRHIIKKAYTLLNNLMADYMQNGKINPVAGIFLMKNTMDYRDETEVVIKPDQALGEVQQADVIADKYKLLPAEQIEE